MVQALWEAHEAAKKRFEAEEKRRKVQWKSAAQTKKNGRKGARRKGKQPPKKPKPFRRKLPSEYSCTKKARGDKSLESLYFRCKVSDYRCAIHTCNVVSTCLCLPTPSMPLRSRPASG